MIAVEVAGYGVVREPSRGAESPTFILTVSQPGHQQWNVYRELGAFQVMTTNALK